MKRKLFVLFPGIFLGIWISLAYINPYSHSITLSQLVLQLSGARGEFVLGTSLHGLLSFTLRLIPCFVFQAIIGTKFYQHFCIASVYIFSRIPNRVRWYTKEIGSIFLVAALYQFVYMLAAITTALVRYRIEFDVLGVQLFYCHLFIYAAWLFFTTLLVNIVAIYRGSSSAFICVVGAQTVSVCVLSLLNFLSDNPTIQSVFLRINPISPLVLCWHARKSSLLVSQIGSPYDGLYVEDSILIMVIICMITVAVGAIIVWRHDLIISNTETGGN